MVLSGLLPNDISNADPADLVRRFRRLRPEERHPAIVGRDAEMMAAYCTRFNEDLLFLSASLTFHTTVANPHVTSEQIDLLLGEIATSTSQPDMIDELRFGVAMAARRNAFGLSDETIERLYEYAKRACSTGNGLEREEAELLRKLLDAITNARSAGGDTEAQRKAALSVLIADYKSCPFYRRDDAGIQAARSPLASTEQLLFMVREFPNDDLALAIAGATKTGRHHLSNPELRRFLAKTTIDWPDTAALLFSHPDPADFEASYETLLSLPDAERTLDELAKEITPDALAPLGRRVLSRLLESPSQDVRILAIAALGGVGIEEKESARKSNRERAPKRTRRSR